MWLAWVFACAVLLLGRKGRAAPSGMARVAVVAAAVVMVGVYLIPHSLRGSQLDYDQMGQGVNPKDAIEAGR